jgi:murein L,D-transpeptidase YcbB/YkuD
MTRAERRSSTLLLKAATLFLGVWSGLCAAQDEPDLDFAFHAEQVLRTEGVVIDDVEILTRSVLLAVYERNGFAPLWSDAERVREVIDLIKSAPDHGLLASDYNIDRVERIVSGWNTPRPAERRAGDDVLLSESLLRYAYHRRYGKVEGSKLDPNVNFRRATFGAESTVHNVERGLRSASLTEFIDLIAPSGPIYRRLQAELARHRDIAERGAWPTIASGPTLRRDDAGPRVAQVRQRLALSGDLPEGADARSEMFDAQLEDAVAVFQERHALDADGIIGARTLAAMNVPIETRIDQLRLSLERLRWVDDSIGLPMIAVNIAGFRAFYFDESGIKWHTRVMVGREYRQTPVFRGEIAYLEFNPTWTIPPGILRNDTLPAVKKDSSYLTARNIRVIDRDGQFVDPSTVDWSQYSRSAPYTFRQDPGPNNALGIVKFIFPNEHFVFLHDTPNRELFSQAERAFSSGCIRVEDPLSLAELVLDDPDNYNVAALERIVDSAETRRVFPRRDVTVLILYLTADIDPSGYVRFYNDIYDRDRRELDALNGPVVIDLPQS